MEIATFAAGCFWGIEAAFREVEGVASARVGYTGGSLDTPTYKDVCSGRTGHAEAVEVTYDPELVSYEQLLGVFWELHNPTTLDRQGPDIGPQYRSAIFFHNPQQETAARASKEDLQRSGKYNREIVTEITPASQFWEAEDYHQQYLEKRGIRQRSSAVRGLACVSCHLSATKIRPKLNCSYIKLSPLYSCWRACSVAVAPLLP